MRAVPLAKVLDGIARTNDHQKGKGIVVWPWVISSGGRFSKDCKIVLREIFWTFEMSVTSKNAWGRHIGAASLPLGGLVGNRLSIEAGRNGFRFFGVLPARTTISRL